MKTIKNRYQLLDTLWEIQEQNGYISDDHVQEIANQLGMSTIEVEGVVSFYHFFKRDSKAKFTVYLSNSIISKINGFSKIKRAFETGAGIAFGKKDLTDTFDLNETSCIGLSDVEPAALINFRPFINLTPPRVHKLIFYLKAGADVDELCDHPQSIIQFKPPKNKAVFLRNYEAGKALSQLASLTPNAVIDCIRRADLRGMGGAFFPSYIKWDGCKNQKSRVKYVVCNADEGEPGTFKDRLLLQQYPDLLLEGMIACGYAVGAREGIIYLRAEYRYLKKKLEDTIKTYKKKKWLGKNILAIKNFDFNIRIQLGAGAYVCGEETALLQSMEGYRGEPRPKVYFPTERGFLNKPTVVNNVETFCEAARILELGVDHTIATGIPESKGTKLISVSGDCNKPGIYEIEWGMSVQELLDLSEAQNPYAVQVSGPSGELISSAEFERKIALNDLKCGGSFMIFNKERDLLDIVQKFNQFFIDESCGVCTPCRAGNFILSREIRKIRRGLMDQNDITKILKWGKIMRYSSRCGLGQTAPNSLIQAIEKFPDFVDEYLAADNVLNKNFNVNEAVQEYEKAILKHSRYE